MSIIVWIVLGLICRLHCQQDREQAGFGDVDIILIIGAIVGGYNFTKLGAVP
jgi:uncharacterized membrane protein YeaQ/YmgE (transglycosylase-associated protein family)